MTYVMNEFLIEYLEMSDETLFLNGKGFPDQITKISEKIEEKRVLEFKAYTTEKVEILPLKYDAIEQAFGHGVGCFFTSKNEAKRYVPEEAKNIKISGWKVTMEEFIDFKLKDKINDLNLSIRAKHSLERANIKVLGELVVTKPDKLRKIKSCGRKTINEIQDFLSERNLSLGMRIEDVIE